MELRQNEVILFQGDSITNGGRSIHDDPNHNMGHGYQYIVGAKLCADNIDKNISVYNRGISGNRISDLYGRWLEDTINIKPSILSILIGVNDALFAYGEQSGSDAIRYEKIYRLMLDEALNSNPQLKLIIMEPFVGESFEDDTQKSFMKNYVNSLQDVTKRIAQEYNAIFIPLQDIFDNYSKIIPSKKLIWDGIHPTIVGHELIARRWLDIVNMRV